MPTGEMPGKVDFQSWSSLSGLAFLKQRGNVARKRTHPEILCAENHVAEPGMNRQ